MCEVLAPVGDKSGFYTAIKSGCDAVYFGLPKFNARLRAENIDMDSLPELVSYAHLKGVKCYLTLNTILTDKEIAESVELVGKCLNIGVDAFIVQDMGLIYALKSVYPNITLHGSTQMGIHNVRGAQVAKELGLERIVLSRECTISDIKEIKDNVDIELEVFIQGAMCVAFSGNCYMSAIKHNASGNRGECKQLCRLNYTLTDSNKKVYGYPLSIRDNCMLEYVEKLMEIGVSSLKIEGRLRHNGYVAVATSTYRQVIDNIKNNIKIDYDKHKNNLSRVFARGEYIPSYNEGNDVISITNNNHIGVEIGEVISCTKFKDIYKITLRSRECINSGDGLKFIAGNDTISMGVGNVDETGNNYVVYGRNYIKNGSKVFKTLDTALENSVSDYSRRRKIDIDFRGFVGNKCILRYTCGNISAELSGDVCECAKSKPLSNEVIINQLTKWDNDIFELGECSIDIENIFLPLSSLNSIRRDCLALLKNKLLERMKKQQTKGCELSNVLLKNNPLKYNNLLMVDEKFNDYKSLNLYDGIILSPSEYSVSIVKAFVNKISKHTSSPIILNLPIIALKEDLKIIDKIVYELKDKIKFVANNIYCLSYLKDGVKMIGGYPLNIINNYSMSKYLNMGLVNITSSIEKNFSRLKDSYKYSGKSTLMVFAHCPNKTINNNTCDSCSYNGNLKLSGTTGNFTIRRYRIAKCYFELVDDRELSNSGDNLIVDIRK